MKHEVKIKFTDLSSEEVEKLIDSLLTYNFKATIKPALPQANVRSSAPKYKAKKKGKDDDWFNSWDKVIKSL